MLTLLKEVDDFKRFETKEWPTFFRSFTLGFNKLKVKLDSNQK